MITLNKFTPPQLLYIIIIVFGCILGNSCKRSNGVSENDKIYIDSVDVLHDTNNYYLQVYQTITGNIPVKLYTFKDSLNYIFAINSVSEFKKFSPEYIDTGLSITKLVEINGNWQTEAQIVVGTYDFNCLINPVLYKDSFIVFALYSSEDGVMNAGIRNFDVYCIKIPSLNSSKLNYRGEILNKFIVSKIDEFNVIYKLRRGNYSLANDNSIDSMNAYGSSFYKLEYTANNKSHSDDITTRHILNSIAQNCNIVDTNQNNINYFLNFDKKFLISNPDIENNYNKNYKLNLIYYSEDIVNYSALDYIPDIESINYQKYIIYLVHGSAIILYDTTNKKYVPIHINQCRACYYYLKLDGDILKIRSHFSDKIDYNFNLSTMSYVNLGITP